MYQNMDMEDEYEFPNTNEEIAILHAINATRQSKRHAQGPDKEVSGRRG